MDLYQSILPSGRAIRFKVLTPSQYDSAMSDAAAVAGQDASRTAFKLAFAREGTKRFLHSVTRNKIAKVEDLAKLEPGAWLPLTSQSLEMPGELNFDVLFSAKDSNALTGLFTHFHELTKDEAEAIAGKALPVSVD